MDNKIKVYNSVAAILIFIGLPVLFWALGDVPRRTVLKESLSILTLVSFSLMLGQFYLARSNQRMLKEHKAVKVIKWHKAIGYIFVAVLMLHPFFIVIPRYFESGVSPKDAFITLITSFNSFGVVLGMISWGIMVLLGLTSFFRKKLPFSYKTWRVIHGCLSIVFVVLASWHAMNLGRHMDMPMRIFVLIVAGGGILLLLNTYLIKPIFLKNDHHE